MFTSLRDQSAPTLQTWLRLLAMPNLRRLAEGRFLTNMFFYSAVLVRFQMDRGLNFSEIFLLESTLSLSIWLLNIPTGVWADRLGYRRLLLIGRVLNATSVVVMLLAHGFALFALDSALFGAGVACVAGSEDALLIESLAAADAAGSGKRSASAFALLGACSSAGFFVGLVTGSLFAAHDPTIAVVATLVPALLAIVVTWRLQPIPAPVGMPHELSDIVPARPLRQAWRLIRREPALVGLSLVGSAAFACVNAIFWYNQPLLGRAGVAARWFGPLTAIAATCAVIVPLALPLAQRWMSRRVCFALALVAPGLAYLALAWATSPWLVVALLALVVGGSAWGDPLLSEALNERIDASARATTLSALAFLGAVAGATVNALIGRAGDAGLGVVGLALGATLLALGLLSPWLMAQRGPTDAP